MKTYQDFNILINNLPDIIEIDGQFFDIETSFKKMIFLEILMFDEKVPESYKYYKILEVFYRGKIPQNIEKAIDEFIRFYRCYKEDKELSSTKAKKTLRGYCFERDNTLFFNAFYKMGIDLTENNMHWFKFRCLMNEIPKDCALADIMHIRTVDISKLSKEQKKYILEYRKKFSLEEKGQTLTIEQRNKAFVDSLNKKGGV